MNFEGHYTIKMVTKLPKRGNANLMYLLLKLGEVGKFYIFHKGNYIVVPICCEGSEEEQGLFDEFFDTEFE